MAKRFVYGMYGLVVGVLANASFVLFLVPSWGSPAIEFNSWQSYVFVALAMAVVLLALAGVGYSYGKKVEQVPALDVIVRPGIEQPYNTTKKYLFILGCVLFFLHLPLLHPLFGYPVLGVPGVCLGFLCLLASRAEKDWDNLLAFTIIALSGEIVFVIFAVLSAAR